VWIRIRAVFIEDKPLAAQYLNCSTTPARVEMVDSATETEAGLRLCAELRIWSCECDASLNYDYGNSDKKGRSVKE
jgi:hypothetical protein